MEFEKLTGLLGDPRQIAAERALHEFRAARPIIVQAASAEIMALALESLDENALQALANAAPDTVRLVVPEARLKNRFGWTRGNGTVSLKPFNAGSVAAFLEYQGHNGGSESWPFVMEISEPDVLEDAALDLAHLALLLPAVAVMDTSRLPDDVRETLLKVSALSIKEYRNRESAQLQIVTRTAVPLEGVNHAEFVVFRGGDGFRDHVAIVISKPPADIPVLTRIHSACLTGDLFGSLKCDCGDQLRGTVRRMSELGGGVVLYLDQEGRGNGIANKIRAYDLQGQGFDTFDADEMLGFGFDQRRFDFAAEMLKMLGYESVRLMTNNPQKIEALRAAGLEVASTHRVLARHNPHNIQYLAAKRDRAGHLLGDYDYDDESAAIHAIHGAAL